jgi:hypothetical protein
LPISISHLPDFGHTRLVIFQDSAILGKASSGIVGLGIMLLLLLFPPFPASLLFFFTSLLLMPFLLVMASLLLLPSLL